MKTLYSIKNFRVFDKKGVNVEVSPLTFLVGCNSSGKSSIVKSLSLLKSFFQQKIDEKHPVIGSVIDFSVKPNDTLGSFQNVVRSSSRQKVVTLAYDLHSDYINDDVTVTLVLGEGTLGNAVVTGVSIARTNGTLLFASNRKLSSGGSMLSVKEAFKNYLIATRFRQQVKSMLPDPDVYLSPEKSKALNDKINALYNEAIQNCDEAYLNNVYFNHSVSSCKLLDKESQLAINKFAKTGIMSYFAIFDEMENMSKPEAIRHFLKTKVKDNEIKEATILAIDIICDNYAASKKDNFLTFYRDLEDQTLLSKSSAIIEFAAVLIGMDHSWGLSSILSPFGSSRGDSVYGIADQLQKGEEVRRICYYHLVHDTLAHLSDNDPYTQTIEDKYGYEPLTQSIPPLYTSVFKQFINKFFLEVVTTDVTEGLDYISSSRIHVRRMYPMEDRTEFTDAVKKYFDTKTKFMTLNPPIRLMVRNEDGKGEHIVEVSDFVPGSFMNKWLKIFCIGDHMSLEMDKNGLGLLLKVYRSENDKKGSLLADMGYGITQLFSILLQIEEMIMSGYYSKFNGKVAAKAPGEWGCILSGYSETPFVPRTVAIEEPEIHLHPKYQSLLAEMFYEAYKEYNIQFIIETHSEYLLRKVQTLIGAKKLSSEEVSMIYVEDDIEVKKGAPKVRRIPIKDDGRLAEPFGPGFYDEADSLSMDLLRIKSDMA